MKKKITIVNYILDGVTYRATLDGHLTQSQVYVRMLMERHIPKSVIKTWTHAELISH